MEKKLLRPHCKNMLRYRLMAAFIFLCFFLLIDLYFYQAVVGLTENALPGTRKAIRLLFWLPTLLSLMAMLWWIFDDPYRYSANFRNWVITGLMATYFSKTVGVLVLLIGDVYRVVQWVAGFFNPKATTTASEGQVMSRSAFLSMAAVAGASVPLGGFVFGIISGAHDYRLRRVKVPVPGLPGSLHGLRIGQLSDIHSGSFWNQTAVQGGVELLMKEKPDLITFTGDLVNNETAEVKDYIPIFNTLKAPLGVYSVTGNHDYGDYRSWTSREEKAKNFQDLIVAHHELHFDLLMNTNRSLRIGDAIFSVVGVENWGAGRFAKYGKLEQALAGTESSDFRLMLSHDPSHWDAEIRSHALPVHMTLSGHTHGFQFGVEIGNFKWSPSQYIYKQWAGLYQDGLHSLYVNRGFGYLAYPGRVGIPPELTVLELVKA